MAQSSTPKPAEPTKTADVLPGPKRFCLTKVSRAINMRWVFAIRYFDEQGREHEELHSADTRVEIDTKRTTVATRIRGKGMILCDCGCDFMSTTPEG